MNRKAIITCASAFALAFGALVIACSDDSSTTNSSSGSPFQPQQDSGPSSSGNNDSGPGNTDGGCTNNPPGCFCGTPTTQVQFLNRCTKSNVAALPVNLTVPPANTTNIP